jgi:outer membrane protein assembly factor BamA
VNKRLRRFEFKTIILLILICPNNHAFIHAQSIIDHHSRLKDSISLSPRNIKLEELKQEKDIIDLYKRIIKNKDRKLLGNAVDSLPGPYLSFFPILGYAIASGYIGAVASNISFYAGNDQKKISSILAGLFYSQYNQYWAIINSDIYLKRDKYNIIGDWRIYKFPTKTYDIGSNSLPVSANMIDYSYLKIHQSILQKIIPNIYLGLGYQLDYHANIKEVNLTPLSTDFQKYGLSNRSCSSGLSLNLLFDNRKNSINPIEGTYCSMQYRQNFTVLGSDNNWNSIIIDAREYIKFPVNSYNVLAFWSYNHITFGHPPYLDLPSIGWDAYNNTGRGYAQGRFLGRNLIYLETEYRFSLTNNRLLGAVLFFNEESLSEWPSESLGKIVPGFGLGLRIKVNKHSRTNLAIDCGFGNHGSRGFSFNLGELF